MASDWQPSKLGNVIAVNPFRPLAKGSDSVYIFMQQVETANRYVNEINHRAFKGSGTRFQNGDTLLARITPCLENGCACVSANGYIESYFRGSVTEKFRARCDEQAMKIVSREITSYSNFRHGKIVNFFRHTWQPPAVDIDLYLKQNDELSSALESIVANKNNISHKGSSRVSFATASPHLSNGIRNFDKSIHNRTGI